jgi:WD40 repeat protein
MAQPTSGEVSTLPDGRAVPFDDVSADGRLFLRSGDGLQIWRLPRPRSRPPSELSLPGHAAPADTPILLAAHFASDCRVWVPVAGVNQAQAWDTATGQPVGVPVPHAPAFGATRLAVSPDGRRVATFPPQPDTGRNGTVQVWDAETGRPAGPPLEHINTALALKFSPDGQALATGGFFHSVHLWDANTGRLIGRRLPQDDIIDALDFSAHGRTLAVGTSGREVRLWDVAGQELRLPPLKHPESVLRVRLSPDGSRLLAVCSSAAHLWDPRTGHKVATLTFAKPGVKERSWWDPCGLFSPDGKAVLISSGYGSFRLWDAANGQPHGPPTPLGELQLSCFAFSPDGRFVVAGHENGTAQVWDAATSRPLGAPAVQPLGVAGVAFAADGGSFLTVAADGTIRPWPVPTPPKGDDERVGLSVQLSTGLRMDEGRAVVPLTRAEWDDLRRRWQAREGEADWAVSPPVADEQWHEARARDAEETRHAFTARWHLDRLITARPDDTRLYLRRGRTHTDEGQWEEAEADYRQARQHGAMEDLLAWYRHRAWACQARGQWSAAVWYLDRLIGAQPEDQELRRRRAEMSGKVAAK